MLGEAETIGTASDLFEQLPGKTRIYRRKDTASSLLLHDLPNVRVRPRMPAETAAPITLSAPSLAALTESLVLLQYGPSAVLATAQGDITYVHGKTGKYLEPAVGNATLNLFAMAREGIAGALADGFTRAVRTHAPVELIALDVRTNGGLAATVNVKIQPLTEPAELRDMVLVVFVDVATPAAPSKPRGKLQATGACAKARDAMALELQQARAELRGSREEWQQSQEALRSANEEMQSTNEELQSTNEELVTSKEELQSMNEELQTVNHELMSKVSELSQAGDDMKNLLDSTDIATLFLDNTLQVRRFTAKVSDIFRLIPTDSGRSISDIVTMLNYPSFAADVTEVLETLGYAETQVTADEGKWYKVRIMPYRTQDNRVDGVVVTFLDITEAKVLEAALRLAQVALEERLATQTVELDRIRLPEQDSIS